jgi:hypothetical protein
MTNVQKADHTTATTTPQSERSSSREHTEQLIAYLNRMTCNSTILALRIHLLGRKEAD